MGDVATAAGADTGGGEQRILRMTRTIAAPREAVFRAWTDPAEFSAWWGPKGCTAQAELDPRPGGAWRARMLHADGGEHVVGGTYLEVVAPERLVFTWAWEQVEDVGHQTTVTLEFIDREGATEIQLTQERFQSTEARDLHNEGWTGCFDCLRDFVAAREAAR